MARFLQKLASSISVLISMIWTIEATDKCVALSGGGSYDGIWTPTGEMTTHEGNQVRYYPVYKSGAYYLYSPEGLSGYWTINKEVKTIYTGAWPASAMCEPSSTFDQYRHTSDVTSNCVEWCIDDGWSCNPASISVSEVDCSASVPTARPTPPPTPDPTASAAMVLNADCLQVRFYNKPGSNGYYWIRGAHQIDGDYKKMAGRESYGQPIYEQQTSNSDKFYLSYNECDDNGGYHWDLLLRPEPHCNKRRRRRLLNNGARLAWGFPEPKGGGLTTVGNTFYILAYPNGGGWGTDLEIYVIWDLCDSSSKLEVSIECSDGYTLDIDGDEYLFELDSGAQCVYTYNGNKEEHNWYLYETDGRWAMSVSEPNKDLAVAWCSRSDLADCDIGAWNSMVNRMNKTVLQSFDNTLSDSRLLNEANQTDNIGFVLSEYVTVSKDDAKKGNAAKVVVLIIALILLVFILIGIGFGVFFMRNKKKGKASFHHKVPEDDEIEMEAEDNIQTTH